MTSIVKCLAALALAVFIAAPAALCSEAEDSGVPGDLAVATVLTEDTVRRYNVRDIVELLNLLPGVSASKTGVTVQGSSSKTVAVILDGRPLFNPASGKVYLSGIPVQSIKEVRLIQGPEAAAYVGNTSGGVIVITSKKGKREYVNKVDVAYGFATSQPEYGAGQPYYYERKRAEGNLGAQLGEAGLFVNLLADLDDGDRVNDHADKLALKANVDFPLAGMQATVSGQVSDEDSGDPGKEYRLTPESESSTFEWGSSFVLRGESFRNRLYANSFHDETANPASDLFKELDSRVLGEEARWSGSLLGVSRLTFSGNVEYREIESNDYGDKDETVGAVSVVKEFRPARNWSVTTGLKTNLYTEHDAQANPQLTVAWTPGALSVSLLLERASTMPTFDQRYYQSTSRLANPGLSLETVYSAKLPVNHKVCEYISWGVTPFFIRERDKIEYYRFAGLPKGHPDYGKAMYRNLSSTTTWGANVTGTVKPLSGLSLDVEYQYMEAKDDDTDNYLFQKPRHKAKLRFRHEMGPLVSLVEAEYRGSRYDDSKNQWELPHQWTLDAKVDYTLGDWTLYAEFDNIFDRRYTVYRGWPGERRTMLFGVAYEF
ncbi:MAG: TonB-dependent receptor plug domain-containing protein [Desulfatibacillaceae bacterium]